MNKLSPRMQIILSMVIFGTIGVFRRWIPFPSSVVALARSVIGLLFLLLLRMIQREPLNRAAIRRNLPKLLLLGAMLGTNWIFLFEAYNHTSVAAATMCYYMAPVFIILLSALFFGEKITPRKGLCAAVAVFGMVLVSDVMKSGLHGAKGLLFGLIAAGLYALIVVLNRTLRDISAEDRTIMQFAASALVMLPYVLLTENLSALRPTPTLLLLLLLVGVLHTGIAYAMYFASIEHLPARTCALMSYIDPVTAVILSALFLQEKMGISGIIGTILIIGSAIVSEMSESEETEKVS